MSFDFFSVPRIVFGWGRRREVGDLGRSLGQRAFVVCGGGSLDQAGEIDAICDQLSHSGVEFNRQAQTAREPTIADVDAAVDSIRNTGVRHGDFVIGVGGGSALDLAKAIAALAPQKAGTSVRDYLEGIGRGLKLVETPLPWLAMPTTGGTGAEATKNAVISSDDPPVKKSLRHDAMLARLTIVDPELSVGVPKDVTAWTGLDAITQCIESYVTKKRQPFAQALAREGLRSGLAGLRDAVHDGANRQARERMSYAALLSGLALANSGLGLAHGVAAALGVHAKTPHGLACAVMLPAALNVNRDVCDREFAELAEFAIGKPSGADLVAHIRSLCRDLGVPERLRDLGVQESQLDRLAADSRGNSMSGNPVDLNDVELRELLASMW